MGLAEADPAQRQRIQAQQRQTGIELHRAGGRNERRGENQQANAHAQDLRGCPGQQKARATYGHVVHGHHGNGGRAGQWIELHRGNPEAAEKGIDQQIAVFGVIRLSGPARPLISHVRPDQAIEPHETPDPGRRIEWIHRRAHAHQSQGHPQDSRCIEPPGQ
ncbi:hypothetical protein D3C84_802430 [compost metagenome]